MIMVMGMVKWVIMVTVLGFIGWHFINKPIKGPKISPQELKELLDSKHAEDEIILIDVRESDEFSENSIPGSISVPLGDLDTSTVLQEISKESQIVVVCLSGCRSEFAQQMLLDMGFKHVYDLSGGLANWSSESESSY